MSGLTGGASEVAGRKRSGSAGGPVKRRSKFARDSENELEAAKRANPGAVREAQVPSRKKRIKAEAKHRTKLAAAPGNPGGLRPSERTPSSRIEAVKARMKKRSRFDASAIGGKKGKSLTFAEDMKKKYPVQGRKR